MSRSVRTTRSRALVVGSLATAAVAVVLVLRDGDDGGYVVRAEFRDAAGLRVHSDVKIGGVPAGRVRAIELTARDTAMVTMRLEGGGVPIGAGATAEARPVNLLGEKYVDLDGGDLARARPSGTTIPLRRTSAPVELDQVIDTLDPTTRGRLRILINEAGIGLRGRAADFNAVLDRMPRSLRETDQLLGDVVADRDRLSRLAVQGDRVLASLEGRRDDLSGVVDAAQRALAVTATAREDLGRTLDAAPGALRQARSTLGALRTASLRLGPAAAELRRTAGPLTGALERLPRLADDAAPTLRVARQVAPAIRKLGDDATPSVRRLATPARELERFSTVLAPFAGTLERQVAPLIGVFEGWTRTIQTRDAAGHLFRTEAVPNDELLARLVGNLTTRPDGPRPQDEGPSAGTEGTPLARTRVPASAATDAAPPADLRRPAAEAPVGPRWLSDVPRGVLADLLDRLEQQR